MAILSRAAYINLYGPTRGDLVRLGATSLLAEMDAVVIVEQHVRMAPRVAQYGYVMDRGRMAR